MTKRTRSLAGNGVRRAEIWLQHWLRVDCHRLAECDDVLSVSILRHDSCNSSRQRGIEEHLRDSVLLCLLFDWVTALRVSRASRVCNIKQSQIKTRRTWVYSHSLFGDEQPRPVDRAAADESKQLHACRFRHSCYVRTVRTLRLGKSSGTLWNFTNFTFCWKICRHCTDGLAAPNTFPN